MLPRIHWDDIYYKNSGFLWQPDSVMEITGSVMIYICWKLHTCCQNFITHRLHIKAKGMFNSNIHQKGAYFITQTGYISMHTRDVQQHKGTYFIPTANTSWITGSIQHVLAYFIIIAKSISNVANISNLLHNMSYFIIIAYFNTTVTTKRMANTRNVTFRQPHTRQMQLPMPSLFLPTISFTLFRFCSKLSIFSTSSRTSVVEAAAMVEEADSR